MISPSRRILLPGISGKMMKRTLRILVEPLRRLGMAIGKVNTFLILCLSYYLILFPVGFARRHLSRKPGGPAWNPRKPLDRSHFEKQF